MIYASWTLWILFSSGGIISPDIKYMQAPMYSKDACMTAGKQLLKSSKGVAVLCLGSEAGEVIRVKIDE